MRLRVLLAFILVCAAAVRAAGDDFTWDVKGRARKGPHLFSNRKGGLYLLCRGKPVFERIYSR